MKLSRQMLVLCGGLVALSCTQVTVEKLPVEPKIPRSNCLVPWRVVPASSALFLGDSTRFSVAPMCESNVPTVRWSSANSAIADVDSISGWVHARALGQLAITAANVADRNDKNAGALEVVARP